MVSPLFSVTIPTYNSEDTISRAINSVENQDYGNIEVIVVDSNSSDGTEDLCRDMGVRFLRYDGKLLGARYEGLMASCGEYVFLMDSDQVLREGCISRCVGLFDSFDMLVLEEFSHDPATFTERLFESDRRLVHSVRDLDPSTSVLLPRVFKRDLLVEAFERIPSSLYPIVVAHDHAIIYLEAFKISRRVGYVEDAVGHIEPDSLLGLVKKNYRYGRTTEMMLENSEYMKYSGLLDSKVKFRKGVFSRGHLVDSLRSVLLLLIKGVPYKYGMTVERFFGD